MNRGKEIIILVPFLVFVFLVCFYMPVMLETPYFMLTLKILLANFDSVNIGKPIVMR